MNDASTPESTVPALVEPEPAEVPRGVRVDAVIDHSAYQAARWAEHGDLSVPGPERNPADRFEWQRDVENLIRQASRRDVTPDELASRLTERLFEVDSQGAATQL